MLQIAVVGPVTSVERILSVASKMKLELEFTPFLYTEIGDAVHIVKANQHKFNGWLFSGPAPYMMARDELRPGAIAVHCLHVGAGLYRGLLQMSQYLNHVVRRVSIDMTADEHIEDNIEEALKELNIPTGEMRIKSYTKKFDLEEVIFFHRDLFRKGLTDGAVTSLHSVYLALKKENVPVFRNTPTVMEIELAIREIAEKMTTAYFKNTQVGLEVIEIAINEVERMVRTPYQLQNLELDIKRILIQLSQKLDGYLMEKGSGRYEIFSSRGAVEREIQSLQDAVEQIRLFIEAPISVGIGFGESVNAAEINAFRAVNHAKNKKCGIAIIEDDGVLIESLGRDKELQYEYYSEDRELLEKLKQAGVSAKVYHKIMATLRRMGWSAFTVSQLADQLSVTPRNISRIVNGLLKVGLAEPIGQEAPAERGRPSTIFRILT